MTSRRRKYHAVREVQSCGPDVWSRSQSFPDSQKFSITSLFDNTLLSVRFSIGRSVRGSGKRASRLVTAPPPFRPTGNRVDNPRQHFVSCAWNISRGSGSWSSLPRKNRSPPFSFLRPGVRQWRNVHVLERILLVGSSFFFLFLYATPCASRSPVHDRWISTRKGKLIREEGSCVRRVEKNAWCRWSTTAKDHLPTTLGQGWSVAFTHA